MATLVSSLVRILLAVLYRIEIRGRIPRFDRTLYIGNHQSFLDAAILWVHMPKDLLWIVHSDVLKNPVFRLALRMCDHLIIDARNPFAMKATIEVIESGRPVVIFPEGRVSMNGGLMKIYDGPGFIAAKSGATVVPFILDGAIRARGWSKMTGDFELAWFPKITVTFFPGRVMPMPDAPTGKLRRRKAGEEMRRILLKYVGMVKPPRSLHDAFLEAIRLHGRGREMVEDLGGARMTYGALLKASLALGRLVSKVSDENEAVGVMLPNAAATLALVLGLFGVRRIPAMLNFTAGADGVQSAIRAAQIRTILTARTFVEKAKLTPLIERLSGVRIVYLEDLRKQLTLADKLWLMLYAVWRPRAATLRSKPQDPAVVIFTSGSEGKPKGVVLAHWSILSDVQQALPMVNITRADKMFSAMPVFHSFGMTAGFMLPIVSGMPVYLYPSPLHYSVVPEMFYDRDATVLCATPTFLKQYAKRAHPYDFRRSKIMLAGAEKLTQEVREIYMEKFGVRLLEGYGATECGPVIALNTAMKFQPGSVGEILPQMEYRIEPVPGIDVGGLLHVRGPNLMLGYWRESNPGVLEPPSSIFGEGWYSTGDLARVDEDGFIYLLGRVKRFAKVAGEMISLEVVENFADAASPKSRHGAVARPDAGRGEMIVLATEDRNLKRDQLQQAAREMGAPDLAIPRRVVYVDKIPLFATGKKDYPKLAQMVEAQLVQPSL